MLRPTGSFPQGLMRKVGQENADKRRTTCDAGAFPQAGEARA